MVSEAQRIRRLLVDAVAVNVLRQVLDVAQTAEVPVAPVKGVVLSRWIYQDLAERPYRDLDLLVPRELLPALTAAVVARGWRIRVQSAEMGELEFEVDRFTVEAHGEFGRRDLSRLSVADVLARASIDRSTFAFETLRIDDVDHLLLLVANVTKKAFTYANAHQPADLERLLARLEPRWGELAARARDGSLSTALSNVARWMVEEHGSLSFERFLRTAGPAAQRLLPAIIRWHRRQSRRRADRLASASGLTGLLLATLTPDAWSLRVRGASRVLRRGALRRLGRNPG